VATNEPEAFLRRLLAEHEAVRDLRVSDTDLEAAFLELTGGRGPCGAGRVVRERAAARHRCRGRARAGRSAPGRDAAAATPQPQERARRRPPALLLSQARCELVSTLRVPEFLIGVVAIPVMLFAMFGIPQARWELPAGPRWPR
jgi:hypothetical protein